MAQIEPFDLEFLRNQIRNCLRAQIPMHGSTLGDMQTRYAKGEQKLKLPKGPHVMHATATRPSGFSRETLVASDFEKAKFVRAIGSLNAAHIQSIQARYSPSREMRNGARDRLSSRIALQFKGGEVRQRAKKITLELLAGRGSVQQLCGIFGIDPDKWESSYHKKMRTTIKARLALLDATSLVAWEMACEGEN